VIVNNIVEARYKAYSMNKSPTKPTDIIALLNTSYCWFYQGNDVNTNRTVIVVVFVIHGRIKPKA
jgi:hypothetical protein